MAITYPTTLDSLANPTSTDLMDNATAALDHWTQHSDANDAIEALEAKVGVNGSAVTTSHDYKLSEVTSTDKAVGKTATQTLTNKTLTSPTVTGMTATTSTVNGVTLSSSGSSSNYLREDGTYGTVSAGDASYASKGSVQGLTDADTSGLVLSTGVISVNSGTTANKIVKLDASAKLPAVDGSQLTNLPYVGAIQTLTNTSQSSFGALTCFTYTIPILKANSYVEIEMPYELDTSGNSTGGTVTFLGTYSSSTVGTGVIEKASIAGTYKGAGVLKFAFKNNGATNSQICTGALTNPAIPSTAGNGYPTTGTYFTPGGTLTVDSTSTQTFTVTCNPNTTIGTVTFSKPMIKILQQN